MKQLGLLLLCAVLLRPASLVAQGPDDRFLSIYALIQQGDSLQANGRNSDAQADYREALSLLVQFEKDFPHWNDPIVQFRKTYLQERVGTATLPTAAAAAAAPASVSTNPQVAALQEELNQLKAERDRLQAKLREALSAQPAGVDPRELARVTERLSALEKTNATLREDLVARDLKLATAPDPARLAEAQKALDDARQNLARQTQAVTSLAMENDALRKQLQAATERAAVKPTVEESPAAKKSAEQLAAANQQLAVLSAENGTLRKQLQQATERAAAKPAPEASSAAKKSEQQLAAANQQLAALSDRVKKLDQELAAERARTQALQAEKDTFEKRVAELKTQLAGVAPTPAPTAKAAESPVPKAAESKPPTAKEEKAMAKFQRESDKLKIRQLERERDDLNKRLRVLSRQLDDMRRQTGATNTSSGTDQLTILRARLEAYEARAVPYTPAELALLKPATTATSVSEEAAAKRPLRQVPAGAATLLADAERALRSRRFDEAERKVQQALQLDERNVDMLNYLAATQIEQARLDEAEGTLKRALAVDPNSPDGLSLMGLLRFRQGKYEEAFTLLSQAAQLNPDNATTQNYLGVTLSQLGQRKAAETALRRALALDPNYGEAHANLARVYAAQKPPFLELARWHYEKAISLGQPKDPDMEKALSSTTTTPAPTSK